MCTCESFESIPHPSAKWVIDNVIRKQKSLHFNAATLIFSKICTNRPEFGEIWDLFYVENNYFPHMLHVDTHKQYFYVLSSRDQCVSGLDAGLVRPSDKWTGSNEKQEWRGGSGTGPREGSHGVNYQRWVQTYPCGKKRKKKTSTCTC